ncbi:hypothetical protein [uncultured Microscilla sp.]|uniref:hypothetical protein n=1 Tax=uncultured Microscilla sp. TaxID=432653 RepID=UPI0026207C01|nr:hypothetical protein [uncultured Microscilla sp.]
MKKILLTLWAFCITCAILQAQNNNEELDILHPPFENKSLPKIPRFLEVGISANAYRGDLNPSYSKWTSSFHIAYRLNRHRYFNSRFGFSIGTVTGENLNYSFTSTDPEEDGRPNNFFKSNLITFHYELQFNLIKTSRYMVYLSQGFGIYRFLVKNDEGENLQDIQTSRGKNENYNNSAVMLPTGIGAAYRFANGYALGLQASILNPQTDYVDNISQLSTNNRNDNTLMFKFFLWAPLSKIPVKKVSTRNNINYTRSQSLGNW